MFNNPVLARTIGALGEQLRFRGTLPDDVRELAILRFATHQGSGYEWSHHQRPAELAGVSAEALAELAAGRIPAALPDTSEPRWRWSMRWPRGPRFPPRFRIGSWPPTARRCGRARRPLRAVRDYELHGVRVRHPHRGRPADTTGFTSLSTDSAPGGSRLPASLVPGLKA